MVGNDGGCGVLDVVLWGGGGLLEVLIVSTVYIPKCQVLFGGYFYFLLLSVRSFVFLEVVKVVFGRVFGGEAVFVSRRDFFCLEEGIFY